MKKSIQCIMACFLVICTMLSMVPTVYAAGENTGIPDLLEPVNLGPAITSSVTSANQIIRSNVQGKDYLFMPVNGSQMVVVDMDAFISNPSGNAIVDVADTLGIAVPRGGVECNGYIYIFGDAPSALYKYNPITKEGYLVDIERFVDTQYDIVRGLTKDNDGNLYVSVETDGILKYDPNTDTAELLYYDPLFKYYTATYDDGYIYCSTYNGKVIKVDASTGELVGTGDHSAIKGGGVQWVTVAGDVVFCGADPSAKGAITFNKNTMELVDLGIGTYFMGKVTTEKDGKHYVVIPGKGLCEFDSETNQVTPTGINYGTAFRLSEAFIEVDGKTCLFNTNGSTAALLNLEDKTVEMFSENWTNNVSSKATIRSLATLGNEIWLGGFQNASVSSYNTETQKFNNKVFSNGQAQTDQIIAYNGKVYLGCYNGAFLVEYDPVTKKVRQLSLGMGEIFNQYRMHALAAGDNKVFFSSYSDGTFGGVMGWYDLLEDTLYVATGFGTLNDETYEEKLFHTNVSANDNTADNIWIDEDGKEYSAEELKTLAHADLTYNFIPGTEGYQDPMVWLPQGLRGIVYHQNIVNLEYHNGYLYCTSCIDAQGTNMVQGGNDARRQEEAVLMVYDVNNKKKADEFFVTTGHDNVIGGIENLTTPRYISGVDVGKDGKLWGVVSETLFSFSYDETTRKLTVNEELSFGKTSYPVAGVKNFDPKPILFDDQGYLYVNFDEKGIYQINCSDTSDNRRVASTSVNKYTLGADGNLYYTESYYLYKVALAELQSATGYTAGISTTSNEVNKGEKVSINVAVDYIAAEGQTAETVFNAGEISLSYDSEKLAFNKDASTLGEATVSDVDAGILKLADYGADKNFGTDVYVLVFDAIESGEASVEMTAAAFSNKSNATSNDLEDAKLGQTKVDVSIDVAHAVTLPEGFSGMLIAEDQKDYTFEAVDKNYDYTLSATVGGQVAEVKDNGDGTYTVAAVTGDLVISMTDKKGKTYDVTFDGTGKDNVTGAEATATYGTDYVFTLPTEEGTVYGMDGITIGGNAYTGYSVSGKTYTIPGSAITGEVVISVTMESVPVTQVSVEVNGTGAGAAADFTSTAVKNKAYTLTITLEAGYDYQVTAAMGGTEVANMMVDGNAYTIPNVTGDIVFTITASVNTDNVSVAEYLTLDGTKMWLVKNATKLAEGKVSTYDGEVMFWSEEYEAYCYLVVADDLQADAAKPLVGIKEGTAVTADYGMDVNMTGNVDANDAQLVYNMYNAAYADFDSNVTMEKFLRADVTADQKVDVNDAAAIIAHVLGITSN